MTAWPMIEKCLRQQWQGLTEEERLRIDADWAILRPGGVYVHSLGHDLYSIWKVEGPGHYGATGSQLLSVKIDHWPLEFQDAHQR